MSKPTLVRCDHALDPRCPWKRCPHHGWHQQAAHDCAGEMPCESGDGTVLTVRCVEKEAAK